MPRQQIKDHLRLKTRPATRFLDTRHPREIWIYCQRIYERTLCIAWFSICRRWIKPQAKRYAPIQRLDLV